MLRRLPPVVLNLLVINALFFVADWAFRNMGYDLGNILGLHYFMADEFRPYQVITSMFMHAGFTHFFFNMFALYMFGTVLEHRMNSKRFLIFYLLCGLGATLLHAGVQAFEIHNILGQFTADVEITAREAGRATGHVLNPGLSREESQTIFGIFAGSAVGASGALYGLLVAFGMFYPNEELMLIFLPIPIKAKIFIPLLIFADFYLGIKSYSWDPIAHYAHLGGALFGFLLIKYWFKRIEFRF
jgi:membrane associated rhomboid family serine protease